jgi:hypothetical protein
MNRRDFVSRVMLGGAAAACTGFGTPVHAAPLTAGQVNVRFVGMMAFVERSDHSFLVATPGQHGLHHMTHTPFLMARKGSAIARALGMMPVPGVVPEAFDTALIGSNPADFVYRSLHNTAIDIVSGETDAVVNTADQMAQLGRIAPGKRVRGNLEKWASSTVSLRGGRIENSLAHPDAGKLWAFGDYRQPLTDAVNFKNVDGARTKIRLTNAAEVRTITIPQSDAAELWVFSAAQPNGGIDEPTMLEHSEVVFDFLVDATPVVATCQDATGRKVPDTVVPFSAPTSASAGLIASAAAMPPQTEFCFIADILWGGSGS